MDTTTVGMDIAKRIFQIHGVNASCQLIDGSKAKLYKPVKVICNIKKAQ